MYQRQAVDQDGDVIAVFVAAAFGYILVDDLQVIVMDVFFVYQVYICLLYTSDAADE